jgi:hypothetical protein
MPKKSFFDFFNKKNKQNNLSDLDSENKTTNPIKKHQQNRKDYDFIQQYKQKVIQETVLDDKYSNITNISNDYNTYSYHPHFDEENQYKHKKYERTEKSTDCHVNINIDESPELKTEQLEPVRYYSIFNYIRSFFSSPNKKTENQRDDQELYDININMNHSPHRLSKISEDENENESESESESESEKEPSQILPQSHQLSTPSSESYNNQLSQIVSLSKKNESSRPSSTNALPLSVFNMRKL